MILMESPENPRNYFLEMINRVLEKENMKQTLSDAKEILGGAK